MAQLLDEFLPADEKAEANAALFRIQMLARSIRNNRELRRVVRQAQPDLQEACYNMIVPHIHFTALPFERLNQHKNA